MLWLASPCAQAQWDVLTRQNEGTGQDTIVAVITNDAGYTLEIYRDSVDAVRSRFSLRNGLLVMAERSCPSFQIDSNKVRNRSLNDAPCLTDAGWAEYILGYVEGSHITSPLLLAVMNGINISYRFRLRNGDYRETNFSLLGSKRALTEAIGANVTVSAR